MITRLLAILSILTRLSIAADDYKLGLESTERAAGVPKGKVEQFAFAESKIFPETQRDCWIYIPAQYDGTKEAGLMVFQDGHAYVSEDGQMRVPIVFDNLIAKGDMPVTVALFINPGHRGGGAPSAKGWGDRSNRSLEYDSLSNAYGRFLIEEMLPYVTKQWNLKLSTDPKRRAICGMSSGGICAWTVAWEFPNSFGKVLSQIGSFTNIRGGHAYPAMIRKTERKPIRVFLQDGSNDLNNLHGNWPLANQEMASALAFAGYDFSFVFGDGAHNGKHGGAILPDSLRWLWRAENPQPAPLSKDNLKGDEALSKVLPEDSQWELVGEGYAFTDGACADDAGNVYFSDLPKGVIHRVSTSTGKVEAWLEKGVKISGMKFGADGKLYAASQGTLNGPKDEKKKILMIDPANQSITEIATDVQPNDLVVSKAGWIYFTDTSAGAVVAVPTSARGMSRPHPVAGGINKPNGIALSPDHHSLVVSEYGGVHGWSFLIAEDGTLRGGERYMELRAPNDKPDSGGDGMITDAEGRYWITSHLGIQMFDATGRLSGVLSRPQEKPTVSCAFAGPYLYACSADKVYRRKAAR